MYTVLYTRSAASPSALQIGVHTKQSGTAITPRRRSNGGSVIRGATHVWIERSGRRNADNCITNGGRHSRKRLLNTKVCTAVCLCCHDYIEENPAWARENGYSSLAPSGQTGSVANAGTAIW